MPARWLSVLGLRRQVIVENPYGRRVQVIELPSTGAHHERDDCDEDDESRQRHHDENHTHATPSRAFGKVAPSHDANTTVSELAGIRTAAMSGLIVPVTASVAPMML